MSDNPLSGGLPGATGRRAAEFSVDRNGRWFYRGSLIEREGLMKLLCGMLAREASGFVLLTPDQRLRVDVADAPFVATDFDVLGEPGPDARLEFVLLHGERVPLDTAHPLSMRIAPDGQRKPYLGVRDGLEATLNRNVFNAIAGMAVQECVDGPWGLRSAGAFFPLE